VEEEEELGCALSLYFIRRNCCIKAGDNVEMHLQQDEKKKKKRVDPFSLMM
jgi:hypothetical protein